MIRPDPTRFVGTVFDRFPGIPRERRRSPRQLIERVAAWHGLTYDAVVGGRGCSRVWACRHDAVAAVRLAFPSFSYPRLGMLFGGRDHTSIRNSLARRGMLRARKRATRVWSNPHQHDEDRYDAE